MSYRREDIKNAIWDDEDFDSLSNPAALLYLWSFTNPRCGMAGVYRIKRRHICEGRLSGDHLDTALEELARSGHLFYVDQYIWVRTRVKHLRTKGGPMAKSIAKDIASLPHSHPFREAFIREYEDQWTGLIEEIQAKFAEEEERGCKEPPGNPSGQPEGSMESGDSGTPSDPPDGFHGSGRGMGLVEGKVVDEEGHSF